MKCVNCGYSALEHIGKDLEPDKYNVKVDKLSLLKRILIKLGVTKDTRLSDILIIVQPCSDFKIAPYEIIKHYDNPVISKIIFSVG